MNQTQPTHPIGWSLLVLLGAASYGFLSPIIKLAYEAGWNEVQVTISQLVIGTALLWIVVLCRPSTWMNPFRGPWLQLSFVGIFGLLLTTVFLNSALMRINASLAIVLLFQFTWISMVMEAILKRRRPTKLQLLSVVIIITGTIFTVGLSFADLQGVDLRGFIFAICSALTYSIVLVFTGRIRSKMDAVLRSAVMMTASLPIGIPLMLLMFSGQPFFQAQMGSLLGWGIVLGLLGPVIPTIFFNLGIPKIGGSLAAILGSAELPVAVIAAFFILGEKLTFIQWIGILLIIVGIIIAESRAKRTSPA